MPAQRSGIEHHTPDTLSTLNPERKVENGLDDDLLIFLIYDTEEQEDMKTEYFDPVQSRKATNSSHMDRYSRKTEPLTFREKWKRRPMSAHVRRNHRPSTFRNPHSSFMLNEQYSD